MIVLAVVAGLSLSGARKPALALTQTQINLSAYALGTLMFTGFAYYLWKNSPAERAKGYRENLGPGEWYVGAFSGFSYLPGVDWKFYLYRPPFQGRTAKNIHYQPGVLGGIKFGRYFDTLPCFGWEFETSFSRNNLRPGQGRISPPVPGAPTYVILRPDWFMIWDTQLIMLARYGFLKDKEVTFGRLQPYVGLGPGFEIIYGRTDSAKNFAIEFQSGLRYMCTRHIAIFFEYKFSYQFAVEYEQVMVGEQRPEGIMRFDVPHHRFVLGVTYHFKNLYGN